MKTIKLNEYQKDGIFIDLDIEYIPYQKLIYNPEKYLEKNKTYYFYCKNGIKSKEVVERLNLLDYKVIRVIK